MDIKPIVNNYKTSILGIIAIVAAFATGTQDFLNSESFNSYVDSIGLFIAGIAALFARDANVSSEGSGVARPETQEPKITKPE